MDYAVSYLLRHAWKERLIETDPSPDLKYILVIPAYKETGLIRSLESFVNAHPPSDGVVEIIVVLNHPEDASTEITELHKKLYNNCRDRYRFTGTGNIRVHILGSIGLPKKHAGPGLARKLGMDEAVRRFVLAGMEDGFILSSDADTLCNPDYFIRIENHMKKNPGIAGFNIGFAHPLTGSEFDERTYQCITEYELHLRYFVHSLRMTGHPNVYHTIGSAFGVKVSAYCKCGGMNRRKAGEDFYFLQKLFDQGNFSELRDELIFPSARVSDRVPFGTGAAMTKMMESGEGFLTYRPELFEILLNFFKLTNEFHAEYNPGKVNPLLRQWLEEEMFAEALEEIRQNVSDFNSFKKRFFQYFNMFRMMKFLNYASCELPRTGVVEASEILLMNEGVECTGWKAKDFLLYFREKEKS